MLRTVPLRPPGKVMPIWQSIRYHLPPLNFITLHYAYFIGVCLVSSIIFWGASTPPRSITYTDSLYLTVSAMTLAGLNTVNLSQLNNFQQIILFILIMLGSAILVSSVVVHVRRKAFERRFKNIIEEARAKRKARRNSLRRTSIGPTTSRTSTALELEPEVDGVVVRGRAIHSPSQENGDTSPKERGSNDISDRIDREESNAIKSIANEPDLRERPELRSHESFKRHQSGVDSLDVSSPQVRFAQQPPTTPLSPFAPRRHRRVLSMSGVGARPDLANHPKHAKSPTYPIPLAALTEEKGAALRGTHKYFNSGGFIGRNSQFHSLTLAERERLGGVEYRAVTLLEVIVPAYFILWQLLGCLGLGAYVANNRASTALDNGLNPWWVGAFNAVSAFNNSGMSLLDANMVAFQTSFYMLITMSLLILAGNTCYPVFLRLILWTMLKILPTTERFEETKITLQFLLDHPRRCYTTLFPSTHTWWLFGSLIVLNGIDWAAFEILNIGNSAVTSIDTNARVMDGLFQAFAVRSGGFYVANIADLRIGLLVLYVIMMYISVYPVVITMRNSNVYEERSLGIYADDPAAQQPANTGPEKSLLGGLKRHLTNHTTANGSDPAATEPRGYFVRQQLRGQLAHDLWWIVLAVLFITITETGQFEADPVSYSVFNVIFEVISAYGCVGISVGLPGVDYSFSGGWHVLSKLILCAVMIRGRHRGLPVAIDRAVLLPGEGLGAAEEEDARIRMEKGMMGRRSGEEGRGREEEAGYDV
jgi:Trk-type K+ transport system membrane component